MKTKRASIKLPSSPLASVAAAFLATMMALPVQAALTLPQVPPKSGSGVPANILFILDDSGSMSSAYMATPAVTSISGGDFTLDLREEGTTVGNSYVGNTIFYNPATDYQPWIKADGSRYATTPYTAAYSSRDLVSGDVVNLSSDARTYYVPKPGNTNLSDLLQYYRYQILANGRVIRSERAQTATAPTPAAPLVWSNLSAARNRYAGNGALDYFTITVPAGGTLTVSTTGANGNADLYIRKGANNFPTTTTYTNLSRTDGTSNESITVAAPDAEGVWNIRVHARNNGSGAFTGVTLTSSYTIASTDTTADGCSTSSTGWGWRNCARVTPTGRAEGEEQQNYANWYTFHRSRMKVAKAGASQAFSELDTDLRVGFHTIHNRNQLDIPVGSNNGRFDDPNGTTGANNNRSTWFARLHAATSSGGTPLRRALDQAGQYFSGADATGPWGPEAGTAQLACRQNFAILTTDGYWNDNATSVMNPVFAGPGNQDGVAGAEITRTSGTPYTYQPIAPYTDTQSNTLADVAMRYWKTDLRTLDNIVPVTASNPAFWQHMVTFGISIGARGVLNPAAPLPGLSGGPTAWPDVDFSIASGSAEVLARIDDLQHAAVNSRGTFLTATNSDEFARGLRNALAAIIERTSSSSNVAANSTSLGTDTRLFQASYIGGQWTGELRAFPVIPAIPADPGASPPRPAEKAKIGTTVIWSASEQIPAWNTRNIFTHDGSIGTTFPSSAQLATLEAGLGTGEELANYIKGDSSKEQKNAGGFYRDRLHLLGDIIHSSPVYVKDSDTIFVGANDGMLHAFAADSGVERFAYIPAGVNFAKLGELGDPDYPHHYFADGPITVSSKAQTPNRNVLVASLGRGGKGLYALDVTSPDAFASGDVLWDVSGDADMGHILGEPFITKLNGGAGTGVIVANGFNSANDTAVLLVLDIDDGSIIRRIETNAATSNGLFGPRGWDNDGNGTVDFVYASDLQGNVWKFDLSGNTSQWDVAYKTGSTPVPLFVATDAAGNRQAITGGISIAIDPDTYKQWVFFGTGRYLTTTDPGDVSVQTMYGIIDGGAPIGTRADNDAPGAATGLVTRTTVAADTINGTPVRGFEESGDALPVGKRGWFVDFTPPAPGTAPGERMVGKPAVVGPVLLFSSIIPSSDQCTPGGRGYINAVNPFTGGSVASHFFDVDGDGQYGDDEVGGVPVGSVDTGVGMNTDPLLIEKLITVGGSAGNTGSVGVSNPAASGRVSWRELIRN